MSTIRDSDAFLVEREGSIYKTTFSQIKEGGGGGSGGPYEPVPGDILTSPAFEGGNGTEANPFVITASQCQLGGVVYSDQTLTLTRASEGQVISFIDENAGTNGTRFAQPVSVFPASGIFETKLIFKDNPAVASTDYTGLLNLGGVYFTWDVSVSDTGITTPVIEKVIDIGGNSVTPPTWPTYIAPGSDVVAANTSVTGLNEGQTSVQNAVGGSGTGLQIQVSVGSAGTPTTIDIINGGENYRNGESITLDLSEVGGASDASFAIYNGPLVGVSSSYTINAFAGTGAGSFQKQVWQFCSNDSFSSGVTEREITTNTTNPTVVNGQPGNSQFFARVKFVAANIESAWSDVIRCTTGNTIQLRYFFKNFGTSDLRDSFQSFDSGNFSISAKPDLYILGIYGTGLNNGGQGVGGQSPQPGKRGTCAMYVVQRGALRLRVNEVDGSGRVMAASAQNKPRGLPDNKNQAVSDERWSVTSAEFTGGTGSGYKSFVEKDDDGFTVLAGTDNAGTGYTVGDIITFQPAAGEGNWGELDSDNDQLLQGGGGDGGTGGGQAGGQVKGWYAAGTAGNATAGGGFPGTPSAGSGGQPSGAELYGYGTTSGQDNYSCHGYGGGGTGWGPGKATGMTGGCQYYSFKCGGGGGGSWYDKDLMPDAQPTNTSYGSAGCVAFANGTQLFETTTKGSSDSAKIS